MRHAITAALLATSMFSLPTAAHAQAMTAEEAAQLRAEIAALKAQVQTLETRLDTATAQPAPAPAPVATPAPPSVTAKPATEISWKGAPEIKTADGWSFKPRGRIQLDVASIDAPAGVTGIRGGTATEFRRVYLGVDGKIPGGFSYRVEADIANSSVELTDVYLAYGTGPLSVTAGQIKPFWSLDDMTSDLFTSFTERAAFTQAFGFERRVGLSAQYKGKAVLLQGGVFGDNTADLTDSNHSLSVDGRVVFMPKLGKAQLHLAASGHYRDPNDPAATNRYRARPFVHTTDVRLVDSGLIDISSERGLGLEGAVIAGPFHAAGEAYWQTVKRSTAAADPTFFGGYAEVGMVLTGGDVRGYKDGAFDRLKPSKPINAGGIGAIEVNARYDYLDLNDAGIVGGQQKTALIGLVWSPIDYIRITANYGKVWLDDARVATATGDRSYTADTFGLRTQVDF
ncbi:porin [Sphingopyxis sp. Root214]|uniref:OprO/OprP family phosphate-selective porin n=1 Tax=unclassified Sphingopyxis TaxID=2614943 RepID=UPI0006FFF7B9|nr:MULTISPECIES: porin [unclassified Sphingopyxis]KQZ71518.1 porin [Sphingopyxis sp. Root154]KRC05428.1 porin [Sphingopyxis sp. Root214]